MSNHSSAQQPRLWLLRPDQTPRDVPIFSVNQLQQAIADHLQQQETIDAVTSAIPGHLAASGGMTKHTVQTVLDALATVIECERARRV